MKNALTSAHGEQANRWLGRSAWLALGIHLLAGVMMLLVLRHGLQTNPVVNDRAQFIVEHGIAWRLAWLTWNLSAVSMLAFVVAFAFWCRSTLGASRPFGRTVIGLCLVAVGFDLSAEFMLMWWMPSIASQLIDSATDTQAHDLFVSVDRWAVLLTGALANGLYTTVALSLAVKARTVVAKWVNACAVALAASGYALSVTALLDSTAGMFWSNVVLLPAILLWMGGMAWHARSCSMKVP